MLTAEIKILDFLPNTLDTRESSTRLFQELRNNCANCTKIELDFEGIDFMSRSFADQFHKDKIQFQEENKSLIELKNTNFQLLEILQAVANTQTKRKQVNSDIQILSFSDINRMEDYIFAW